jgi:peroxisome-assembly ATPase
MQLDTIEQLQRLYQDLIQNEDCHLDRYKSSERERRTVTTFEAVVFTCFAYSDVFFKTLLLV